MLDQRTTDALQEIGNVGAAHAATALSQLLAKTIMISVPSVRAVAVKSAASLSEAAETLTAGVQFYVVGDASARILLLLPRNCAMELVDVLLKNSAGTT